MTRGHLYSSGGASNACQAACQAAGRRNLIICISSDTSDTPTHCCLFTQIIYTQIPSGEIGRHSGRRERIVVKKLLGTFFPFFSPRHQTRIAATRLAAERPLSWRDGDRGVAAKAVQERPVCAQRLHEHTHRVGGDGHCPDLVAAMRGRARDRPHQAWKARRRAGCGLACRTAKCHPHSRQPAQAEAAAATEAEMLSPALTYCPAAPPRRPCPQQSRSCAEKQRAGSLSAPGGRVKPKRQGAETLSEPTDRQEGSVPNSLPERAGIRLDVLQPRHMARQIQCHLAPLQQRVQRLQPRRHGVHPARSACVSERMVTHNHLLLRGAAGQPGVQLRELSCLPGGPGRGQSAGVAPARAVETPSAENNGADKPCVEPRLGAAGRTGSARHAAAPARRPGLSHHPAPPRP